MIYRVEIAQRYGTKGNILYVRIFRTLCEAAKFLNNSKGRVEKLGETVLSASIESHEESWDIDRYVPLYAEDTGGSINA